MAMAGLRFPDCICVSVAIVFLDERRLILGREASESI